MPWACQAGATLLIPSGEKNHLFVILNSPTDYPTYPPQSCVLVSFSTIRKGPYDPTRIVQAGAHPFLQAPSFVAYRQHEWKPIPRESVTEEMRKDLIAGLYVSPLTPRYLKKLVIA